MPYINSFSYNPVDDLVDETRQLEINFGDDYCSRKKPVTRGEIYPFSGFEREQEFCPLCRYPKSLTESIPIGLDGMSHVATPYSDTICRICAKCYFNSDGDEVWRLYDRRKYIQDDVLKSRTFCPVRRIITEKKWEYMDAEGFVSPFPKKSL